jgi:hypothetical protein
MGFEATGALKAHFGSRGGQEILNKIQGYFDPRNMSAGNMKSGLDGMIDFMRTYEDLGSIHTVNDVESGRWIPTNLSTNTGGQSNQGATAGTVPIGARPISKGGKQIGYIGSDGKRVDF